jgi:hypothetical protein
MTNNAALQSTTSYPIVADTIERLLVDRGLEPAAVYSGKSQAFDLAKADLYKELIAGANISEGGYSVSMTEKTQLLNIANSIYAQYSEPLLSQPTIKGVKKW